MAKQKVVEIAGTGKTLTTAFNAAAKDAVNNFGVPIGTRLEVGRIEVKIANPVIGEYKVVLSPPG